jgi:trehalose 6-phosphate synthase
VNRRFAEAVLEEVRGKEAAIWFQDYHLALAPLFVRGRRPDVALAHFWHIPFPPIDIFRLSPHSGYLLKGLLANDLMGFHLPQFADNFLRCARRLAGAEVDWEARTATVDGHTCHVGDFPISIDVKQFREAANADGVEEQMERLRARYSPRGGSIGIGVDRMDYSKGLPEKFKALEFLWDRYPEFRERFTFIQVAVPSRSDIEAYDELAQKVDAQVREINERFGTADWRPIHLVKQSLPAERLAIVYRMADVCLISSLQDGMNLVAKEFVASQADRRGVLLLSEFAGAAEEMADGAVLMNPYDPEGCALKIRDALTLPADERAQRMERLQKEMKTIFDWMADLFTTWGEVTAAMPAPTRRAPDGDDDEEDFLAVAPSVSRGYDGE